MIVFCIAVQNRAATLIPALDALKLAGDDYRLNLFDWGSTDCNYHPIVQQLPYPVSYLIEGPPKHGFNRGAARQHSWDVHPPRPDDIVVFLDADMLVPPDFCNVLRKNVSPGKCYFPICYSLNEGAPASVKGDGRSSRCHGWWRDRGFGNCAFVAQDFLDTGGWTTKFGARWGGEDAFMHTVARQTLKINRDKCAGLYHQYHVSDPGALVSGARFSRRGGGKSNGGGKPGAPVEPRAKPNKQTTTVVRKRRPSLTALAIAAEIESRLNSMVGLSVEDRAVMATRLLSLTMEALRAGAPRLPTLQSLAPRDSAPAGEVSPLPPPS